jgi:hypothetical protein
VAEIAGCLLAMDLTGCIRFHAVCKSWRTSTEARTTRAADQQPLLPPQQGYALQLRQRYYDTRRRLLNIATAGACIVDDFPELSGHHALGYAEGLARRPLKHGDMRHPAVQPAHMHDHRPPGTLKAATDGALLSFTGFSVTDGGAVAASLPDGGAVFVWEKGPDRYSPS